MTLKLILELRSTEVIVGEAIPVRLTLQNDADAPCKLPYLIDSGQVTNFVLYDDKKEKMGEYNGFTSAVRKGMIPNTTVTLVDLGGKESWLWDVDLNTYIWPGPLPSRC